MPPTNQSITNYIGAGFSFPINVNVQGSVQLSNNTPNLEESIIIILGTKLGERLYCPNFGSRLSELVFEPMNTKTLLTIRLYVEEAHNHLRDLVLTKKIPVLMPLLNFRIKS